VKGLAFSSDARVPPYNVTVL